MNSEQLIESFLDFKEIKNINRVTLMRIMEEIFRTVISKEYDESHFDIIINADKGDLEIWRNKEIVYEEELEDSETQITITKALKIDEDFEVGEEFTERFELSDFGRRNVLLIRQLLIEKIKNLYNEELIKNYRDRIGELIIGEVYQARRNFVIILDDDGNELILYKDGRIPGDFFKKGDSIKAVITDVVMEHNPKIVLSRTDDRFLEKLLEVEIPEINDGLINVISVIREPGVKSKILVESIDDRIDPVGSCVGMRGSRINPIVRELNNESIDVINYTNNSNLLISRLLSPAKIKSISIEDNNVSVFLNPDEISKAIGKGGSNIRLASKISGFNIDVYRDGVTDEEDIDLVEFNDEIEEWIIDEFINIGLDTAKSVMKFSSDELLKRVDLEEDTIENVLNILNEEFK